MDGTWRTSTRLERRFQARIYGIVCTDIYSIVIPYIQLCASCIFPSALMAGAFRILLYIYIYNLYAFFASTTVDDDPTVGARK
jgi:hypothetical protein